MNLRGVLRAATLLALPNLVQAVDFATQVHPILALSGGASGPAIVPGKSGESLLIEKVSGKKGAIMPAAGEPLTASQIGILRAWIDEGAVWPETPVGATSGWVAPIAPRRPELPGGTEAHPIDHFLAVYFAKHDMAFPAPAGDAVFARRVYFDLWGLPPTPEQLGAFLSDPSPGKRARLGDSTLYAEHWISWWYDLLRNDTGVNYQGERESITDWLLNALERNLPYDQMIAALVNLVQEDDPEGFLIGVNWRGDVNASQTPYMQAAQNTAQIFLGINLKSSRMRCR